MPGLLRSAVAFALISPFFAATRSQLVAQDLTIPHGLTNLRIPADNYFKEVVEYSNQGGELNPQLDEEIFSLKLSAEEVDELIHFLEEGLSGDYP